MNKKVLIYFIRRSLKTHVGINLAWVDELNKYQNTFIFTTVPIREYLSNWAYLKRLKKYNDNLIFVPAPKIFDFIITALFLLFHSATSELYIHFKKRSPNRYRFLKFFTKTKFIIDLEGDPEAELEFLVQKYETGNHPEYEANIRHLKSDIHRINKSFKICDIILVSSKEYAHHLAQKLQNNKVFSVPTGFDHRVFRVEAKVREDVRSFLGIKKDQILLVYSGNIYYSWQNFSKTCRLVEGLQKKYPNKYRFLSLIREDDLMLAQKFIDEYQIQDPILKNVQFSVVSDYLNASDCGILLRENHALNMHASPGKIGEYLSCGLPIIISNYIGTYSSSLSGEKFVFFFDMDNGLDTSQLERIDGFLSLSHDRKRIHKISKDRYSVMSNTKTYLSAIQ